MNLKNLEKGKKYLYKTPKNNQIAIVIFVEKGNLEITNTKVYRLKLVKMIKGKSKIVKIGESFLKAKSACKKCLYKLDNNIKKL